jgi:uncharacterized protein
VRIWIDMTAPAHPLVFRPIISRLRAAGHEVEVTARDYADTLGLLELHGIEHVAFGRHGGAGRSAKLASLVSRRRQMCRFGRGRKFELAVAHGSNELPLAAARLGIPAVDMFDYEFAVLQHNIGCRLARKVLTPDAIPPQRLRRYGVGPRKLDQYPGLKEEYYLADFEPDPAIGERLGLSPQRVLVVLRPPPDVSLYHRRSNPLYRRVLEHLGGDPRVQAVVLPRTAAQRTELEGLDLDSLVIPPGPVDAQSLIAIADLVVSAGGTMNREAVAMGTRVFTTYAARLGGVDEALMREGRLRPLTNPAALPVEKADPRQRTRARRDPGILVERILAAA